MRIYKPNDTLKSLSPNSKFICDAYGEIVYKGDLVVYNSSNQLRIGYIKEINISKAYYIPDEDYIEVRCYITVEERDTKELTTLRKTTTLIKK